MHLSIYFYECIYISFSINLKQLYTSLVATGMQHCMNTRRRASGGKEQKGAVTLFWVGDRAGTRGLNLNLKQQETGFDVKVEKQFCEGDQLSDQTAD